MFIKTVRFRARTGIIAVFTAVVMLAGSLLAKGVPAEPVMDEGIALPIIMYHGIIKDESRPGTYVVTADEFESDLKYLKENGYTTVVVQDLLDYVKKGTPLPKKPIMLTFDDGFYNNYVYAYPLLQSYGAKMVLSPVGSFTDAFTKSGDKHAAYSYLNWEDIKTMSDSGLVEIQNHTYDLHSLDRSHNGSKRSAAKRRINTASGWSPISAKCSSKQPSISGAHPPPLSIPTVQSARRRCPLSRSWAFPVP